MESKQTALNELEAVIREYDLKPSMVGRAIASDPGLLTRMRDPSKTISTTTLDSVWRFILETRGQQTLTLEKEE
ncbi:MAG: hypothetical protein ABGX63_00715 [bacterium]|jgi:tRNA-dihydrouridine synthase